MSVSSAPATHWRDDPSLSETWKFRFDFFEKHGTGFPTPEAAAEWKALSKEERAKRMSEGNGPTSGFSAAFKALSFGQRMTLNWNFYAFFFSIIYYVFFLKLWRQALIYLGISLVAAVIGEVFGLSDSMMRGLGLGLQAVLATMTNRVYYLKRTQGDIGWRFW
jgi:hypothetical protein